MLEEGGLHREIFLARRACEEGGDLLKLLLGQSEREQRLDLLVGQLRRLVELGFDCDQGRPEARPRIPGARGRDVVLELGHHRRHGFGDGVLDAHGDQKLVRGGHGAGRRRGRRGSRRWRGDRSRGRARVRRSCRHAQAHEHEQGESAFGESGAGGHERLLGWNLELQSGSPRTSTPSAPAMIAVRAKPMNSPCSTTPGISDKALAKSSGSAMA